MTRVHSTKMTRPRALWLAELAKRQPIARPPRGDTAFRCRLAGWTSVGPEGHMLTGEGWVALSEAIDRLVEVEELAYLRGSNAMQARINERLLRELEEGAQEPSGRMTRDAEDLARLMMRITEASGADRLVIAAALWRCVIGFHARLALDAGDPPDIGAASLLEAAIHGAELAAELARSVAGGPVAGANGRQRATRPPAPVVVEAEA